MPPTDEKSPVAHAIALGFDPELTKIARQYDPELFDAILEDALASIPEREDG